MGNKIQINIYIYIYIAYKHQLILRRIKRKMHKWEGRPKLNDKIRRTYNQVRNSSLTKTETKFHKKKGLREPIPKLA